MSEAKKGYKNPMFGKGFTIYVYSLQFELLKTFTSSRIAAK
jgi:hypothetical protein